MTRHLRLALVTIAVLAAAAAGIRYAPDDSLAAGAVLNAGFESGVLDGNPVSWTVAQPVPDVVKVVDTEGGSEFQVYADAGVTVSPYQGAQMLRLGTPVRVAQNQNRGANAVSQTFTSDESTLTFATRLFSWEHRDTDEFRFDLKQGGVSVGTLASPFVVTMPSGATRTCTGLPCAFSIDVGSNGQFLNSGWIAVTISSIPVGVPTTLSYSVSGTGSESHPTWAYFDAPGGAIVTATATSTNTRTATSTATRTSTATSTVSVTSTPTRTPTGTQTSTPTPTNTPTDTATPTIVAQPVVAKFRFEPLEALEGDLIQLIDESFDPDSGDTIVAWEWSIDGDMYTAQNPIAIFPDEGTYTITLTVTSSDGSQSTASTGGTADDGSEIPPLVLGNADPLVNALNIEVLAGGTAPLVGRFADQGWLDEHDAEWSISGGNPAATLSEDNLPALSIGSVTGTYAPSGDTSGTLLVQDFDGGSGSDSFDVTVVTDNPDRHEPNEALGAPPILRSDGSYLSYIATEGDVDVFEVKMPDGSPVPEGTELLVTLREQAVDLDVAVITELPENSTAAFARSDVGQMAFARSAFARSAFARSAFARSAFARSAFARSAFARSAFARSQFTFAQVPVSELSFTGADGSDIGGTDLTLAEIGLAALEAPNVHIAAFSANRGIESEAALARADLPGTRLFVAVLGANGARSLTPYRLQIETSKPLDLAAALGPDVCTSTPLVPGATSAAQTLYDYPGTNLTVMFTQRERMMALYGMDGAAWDAFMVEMVQLASHPNVAADIVSLPGDDYDAWDIAPCSIDAVNATAAAIKGEVQAALLATGAQYAVFLGDDDVVPYRRVPDETIISNERDYGLDSFLEPGSPLFASIVQGYNLSDDYYVDAAPELWQGRELYVPDLPLGRLVETPAEIVGSTDAFVASGGVLDPQSGFVTGYDFFDDGAAQMAASLASSMATTTLINDTWTSDDLRCLFLGVAGPGCGLKDVAAINAHFTHYAALSANGFENDEGDIFYSEDVAGVTGGGLEGTVVFSMGCHAGLNVPDGSSQIGDAGLGLEPGLDFPQALAQQRAIYIASTGYGLGDDEGIGGTERLLLLFAQGLASGGAAGQALVDAKQEYVLGTSAMTVYDEKSLIQTVFYGLPMYQVVGTGAGGGAAMATGAATTTQTTIDAGEVTKTEPISEVPAADGTYFTADGDSQGTAGRPIQPRVVFDLASDPTNLAHGVILVGGAYEDLNPFDPVITLPTNEWKDDPPEPEICLNSYWPAELGSINTLDAGGAIQQTLVVLPAQFRCTSGGAPVIGLERLFPDVRMELLRCPSDDFSPAELKKIRLRSTGATTAEIEVEASDPSGIARIVVARFSGGIVTSTELDNGSEPPSEGTFVVELTGVAIGDEFIVQVVDGACNVATSTGKGVNLRTLLVDAGPDQEVAEPAPNSFPVTIAGFGELETPVLYDFDFGDGTYASGHLLDGGLGTVPYVLDGDGDATFVLQHTYAPGTPGPLDVEVSVVELGGGAGSDTLGVLDDGVDEGDNCPDIYNPGQENDDGEPILLPKPVPSFDDATNPVGDIEGDACDPDMDGDSLLNVDETANGTDPSNGDTDGDRVNDGTEVLCGSDPLLFASVPNGTDSDADGLGDACEALYGTNPGDIDSDDDGARDGPEVKYWMSDPLDTNTEDDDCTDGREMASVNADRVVNSLDMSQLAARFGTITPGFRSFDMNGDGTLSAIDLGFAAQQFGPCVQS